MFKQIHKAYEIKSLGGVDNLGNAWPKLSPATIAARPIQKGELSRLGLTYRKTGISIADRTRGLLTPDQDKIWKIAFRRAFLKFVITIPEDQAAKVAARIAWAKVKRMGAMTKKEKLSEREVLIMRLSDAIFDSLEPNKPGNQNYRAKENQLVEVSNGRISLGTLVHYAQYHNSTRPVIPDDHELWIKDAHSYAMKKAMDRAVEVLQR